MLKIKIIAIIVIFATIALMGILLYFTYKANRKLKQEKKNYEKTIKNTNKAIKEVCETHEKINENPNSVGFANGIELLHDYSKRAKN